MKMVWKLIRGLFMGHECVGGVHRNDELKLRTMILIYITSLAQTESLCFKSEQHVLMRHK